MLFRYVTNIRIRVRGYLLTGIRICIRIRRSSCTGIRILIRIRRAPRAGIHIRIRIRGYANLTSDPSLLYRFCSVSVGSSVLSILTQFLSNRSQHVMVYGCCSKLVNAVSGVP